MLGGAAVSLGLPPLEAMLNSNGNALAGGEPLPKRYISWFFGNGVVLDRFEPELDGEDWALSEELMPLAAVKDYLTICSGLLNRSTRAQTHHEGMTVFSGWTYVDEGEGQGFYSNAAGPTIDHLISESMAGQTPQSSIHLGISKAQSPADYGTTMHHLSHRGYLQPNTPVLSPTTAWEILFGTFVQPVDDRPVRQSILDACKDDTAALRMRLGSHDQMRLDEHLASIEALQNKLNAAIPVCTLPPDPMNDNTEQVGSEALTLINELMSDLVIYAFACDITRVATVMFLEGAAEPALSEIGHNLSWHETSHRPEMYDDEFHEGILYIMERFGYLLEGMQAVQEPDETNLLDSSIVYCSSDCSSGWQHSIERQPIIIAGHGRGHLKSPGVHYRTMPLIDRDNPQATGNVSDVLLAMLQAFNPDADWIGEENGGGAGSGTPQAEILA
jgi:hypothetical protein